MLQNAQRFVERNQIDATRIDTGLYVFERYFHRAPTPFLGLAGPRLVHQDATHLLAGDRKKVQPILYFKAF